MTEPIKKKRGRKPKNYNSLLQKEDNIKSEEKINSEDETIILHLPITIDEINSNEQIDMSLFITSENQSNKLDNSSSHDDIKSPDNINSSDNIKSSVLKSSKKLVINNDVNTIIKHSMNFDKNTKCWWCKNCFKTPPVQLPEDYYNETFFCIGHFCSFSCVKSYNSDINDSLIWKRESLINLLYFMTYSKYIEINPAPHWITLKDFGGNLSIEEFRKKSNVNSKEYLILHPPLVSRQIQIEESYKLSKLKEVSIDNINKIYSDIDSDYTIKRKNPIQSKQLNLENTMGLIKKKKPVKTTKNF